MKYPSTGQFRNALKFIQHNVEPDSVVCLTGTVKIHGTNASIIMLESGEVQFMSKNRILDVHDDNYGFCNYMINQPTKQLFDQFIELYQTYFGGDPSFPIRISGEWAGKGIQSGVAVGEIDRFFTVFGIRVGDEVDSSGHLVGWLPNHMIRDVKLPSSRIFNVHDFQTFSLGLNVARPDLAVKRLEELTLEVERECPVGKFFNVEGVGEGIVWTPILQYLAGSPQSWFKVKGQKHSVTKVNKLVSIDTEKLANIYEFVEYAVTDNRLEQGLQEVGLDIKTVGSFISWVSRDIIKEEGDTLEASGLTMKEVGKYVAHKARTFYLDKIGEDL